MVEIIEVIIDTGGIPFSPRVKSDDGKSYLDCPRVVTDLVYTKAKDWYGDNLPYNIEERIATELYGDIVLKSVKDKLSSENLSDDERVKRSFANLHEVILKGFDAVKDLVRSYIKKNSEESLSDDDLEKELNKN